MKTKIQYRHGDVMLEHLGNVAPEAGVDPVAPTLAEGEVSGHSHRLFNAATMFRDDGLARSLGAQAYIGTVDVPDTGELRHVNRDGSLTGEHSTIVVPAGRYAVIAQREYDPFEERRAQD